MTAEFPYLITNRISAPLELCGEESDEWQGSTQWPERDKRARDGEASETESKKKKKKEKRDGEKRTRVNAVLSFLPTPSLQVEETLYFPSTAEKKRQFLLLKLAGVC